MHMECVPACIATENRDCLSKQHVMSTNQENTRCLGTKFVRYIAKGKEFGGASSLSPGLQTILSTATTAFSTWLT